MARAVVRASYVRVARVLRRLRDRAGSRAGSPAPLLAPAPAPRSPLRALGLLAVAATGAWLGLLAVGGVRVPVGPVDTSMTLRPSLTGGTEVNVPPLGALGLDSHTAPVRLAVDVDRLDPVRSRALVEHPERISGLQEEIAADVLGGTRELAVRSCVAVVTGATALGLVVYRRPRRALASGGLALALLAASGASAYATWNPKSVLEPRFSGLLSSAPSVVGSARSIVTEFDVYQRELARLVTNVTRLYEATSTLPTYQPDPATIRVLHVSDIHLNPASWHIVGSLVEQYDIDLIIDSGDTMDHGSTAENVFLNPISGLGAPYVWVRGNHDSAATQEYLEGLRNVHVLDGGRAVTVAGVRVAGIGDPQFTPDRSVVAAGDDAERAAGDRLARALRAQARAGTPVDVAVVHNPVAAHRTDGAVPLVLSGHVHRRVDEVLPNGTRLKVEGSTGGGGLRAVEKEEPEKVHASVLYLDRETRRLQAWDEITLGGLGLTTAEVARRVPDEALPGTPSAPAGTPAESPRPSGPPAPPPGRSSAPAARP
ncbi:metallophosphoesterase [Streptomyces somaliensis]|uniref:metallophosphoesterase family protein n=1 Tax=Streptomyces somaliensis TaxID=78355 RepID=UPI0020CDB137|nr:metallophosphoesterase [Streptomyces somaliensis]MCP9945632.1 metallophosphoesterase [Streptomyces somaliensis]MCP9961188.1 metallophosphoesterase [Streptomyces somaliensis]MCP9973986.1 metallophosphoesterase [Streptomyces somaliensis]